MEWVSVIRQFQLACQPAVTTKADLGRVEAAEGADLNACTLRYLAMPLASCSDLPLLRRTPPSLFAFLRLLAPARGFDGGGALSCQAAPPRQQSGTHPLKKASKCRTQSGQTRTHMRSNPK